MNDAGTGAGLLRRSRVHVKARTATALRLPVGQIHDLGDVEVAISNWIEQDAAGPIHRGLFFDTRARATTPDAARALAMRACDGVLSSLCFVSGTGAGPLEPLAVFWDMVDGCHLQQFIELPLGPMASRLLVSDRVERVLQAVDVLTGDYRDRIYTAMSWYRKAAAERQPIDAFTACWLGLETLNALLARHYGVTNERTVRSCPKCGADVITAPTSAGIRELLTHTVDADLWHRAHRRRIALLHASRPLSEVHDDLPELVRSLTGALRQAILLLLGVRKDEAKQFDATPMPVPRRHRARADILLPDFSVEDVPRGSTYPLLRLHAMPHAERSVVGKRTVETVETQWELVNFAGPRYKFVWSADADRDPDDTDATAEVRMTGQAPK